MIFTLTLHPNAQAMADGILAVSSIGHAGRDSLKSLVSSQHQETHN
jgi:hypothetical protein